jgi:hypothetical protein
MHKTPNNFYQIKSLMRRQDEFLQRYPYSAFWWQRVWQKKETINPKKYRNDACNKKK